MSGRNEAEQRVRLAAERGDPLSLEVSELSPQRVLELLGETGASYRLSILSGDDRYTVELGNGLIVGAEAMVSDRPSTGKEAYHSIRLVRAGELNIEPLRFPSLANILQPASELPDLKGIADTTPIAGPDTVELSLPEARPDHSGPELNLITPRSRQQSQPRSRQSHPHPDETLSPKRRDDPTIELDLIAEGAEEITPDKPPAVPQLAQAKKPTRQKPTFAIAAVAAAAALAIAGGAWAGWSPRPEAAPPEPTEVAAASAEPSVAEAPADPAPDTAAGTDASAQARALARAARRHLRAGQHAEALVAARRAAQIRGGRPFYQVVLGDALRANGQRAASRRAYRRALRLRPGYAPATRRLARGGGSSSAT